MASRKRMGNLAGNVSDPSERTGPCDRCRGDSRADPCGPCPLYPAWLERLGLADEPAHRARYAAWVGAGGWRALWAINDLNNRRVARIRLVEKLRAFPRWRPR
jgi:hypothetical protein